MRHNLQVIKQLKLDIDKNGPIPLRQFMDTALYLPQHGYYNCQDVIGHQGDFTTSPEISQVFGEIIGLWCADMWLKMGKPQNFYIIEMGPGRGTLMSDVLRTIYSIPNVTANPQPILVEVSPQLMDTQKRTLEWVTQKDKKAPLWSNRIDAISIDAPAIVIGNEIFDAIPFDQYVFKDTQWHCQHVDYCDDEFSLSAQPCDQSILAPYLPQDPPKDGDVLEISPDRNNLIKDVVSGLQQYGGCALFFDYGHEETAYGDTFQAVHKHMAVPVLESIGNADLTSHVDFGALLDTLSDCGIENAFLTEQGAFLSQMGGAYRAQYLAGKAANETQSKSILDAYDRIRDDDKMGRLFKVLSFACEASR